MPVTITLSDSSTVDFPDDWQPLITIFNNFDAIGDATLTALKDYDFADFGPVLLANGHSMGLIAANQWWRNLSLPHKVKLERIVRQVLQASQPALQAPQPALPPPIAPVVGAVPPVLGAVPPLPVGADGGVLGVAVAAAADKQIDQNDVWPDVAWLDFKEAFPPNKNECRFAWQRRLLELLPAYEASRASLPATKPVCLELQKQLRSIYVSIAFPDPSEALVVNSAKSLFSLANIHQKPFAHLAKPGRSLSSARGGFRGGFARGFGSGRGRGGGGRIPPGAVPLRPCRHCGSNHFDFDCPTRPKN